MFSPTYLCLCLYCMLQLGFFMYIEDRRHTVRTGQRRYFLWMLIITQFSFAADMISSIHTGSAWLFPFTAAGNYLEIVLNTALIPIFYRFICDQIFKINTALKRRLNLILWILAAICAALVVSTAFTGKIFYYDAANVYHRGPLFPLPMLILFAMMGIVEAFLIGQKKRIEPHYYKSLVLFMIPPLVGWALQVLIYGLPFSLLGITFSSLVLFTNIQNYNMDKDYLTEVFNRQTLDRYMQHKIDTSTKHKTFSAILLDIDDFKSINDRFGHFEGDTALINAVKILRDSLEFTDFIARYGGDEFCIILDSDDSKTVETIMLQIDNRLLDFNKSEDKPYRLNFSMGYAIYHVSIGNKSELFFKEIDRKMYEKKNDSRAGDSGYPVTG